MARRKDTKKAGPYSSPTKRPVLRSSTFVLMAVVAAIVVIAVVTYLSTTGRKESPLLAFKVQGQLAFVSSEGDTTATIDIEIADTDAKRRTGMMYRRSLDTNQGLLFVFEKEEPQAFWMRNTFLPLDIIFVNKNLDVVAIQKNTTPLAQIQYSSDIPAAYVVEVNAGFSDEHGIRLGDRITWTEAEDSAGGER